MNVQNNYDFFPKNLGRFGAWAPYALFMPIIPIYIIAITACRFDSVTTRYRRVCSDSARLLTEVYQQRRQLRLLVRCKIHLHQRRTLYTIVYG